nr:DJ-1/PfpI family protein [Mycolicibacterium sphagni]
MHVAVLTGGCVRFGSQHRVRCLGNGQQSARRSAAAATSLGNHAGWLPSTSPHRARAPASRGAAGFGRCRRSGSPRCGRQEPGSVNRRDRGVNRRDRGPAQRRATEFVTAAAERGVVVAGACTGTFFLAEAGVLNGRHATTSWRLGPAFRARYPLVDLDTRATLVHNSGVATAAAAFAHIDLALWLVRCRSPACRTCGAVPADR